MTAWRPTAGADVARRRAELLGRAHNYFSGSGAIAVDTPALGQYPSVDAHIESFSVASGGGPAGYLHSSPEVAMKRLLAAGYPDIYSICRVWRARESGTRHLPEFTIAEWYRLGFGFEQIIADTLRFIAACLELPALESSAVQHDYADVLQKFADIDPFEASADEVLMRATDDARLREQLGTDRNAALDLILSEQVVPHFAPDCLTVVRHYPAAQAALARRCAADERVADRFEVFCGDLELANGYVELCDPGEQAERLGEHCDLSLIAALKQGLPDCAGVAVGMERLQMVSDQADDIRDVVCFVPASSD